MHLSSLLTKGKQATTMSNVDHGQPKKNKLLPALFVSFLHQPSLNPLEDIRTSSNVSGSLTPW